MLLFPGGKIRAFTMSYDDGVVQDRRLAPLLREYGIKCTFNLGAGLLGCPEPDGFPENRIWISPRSGRKRSRCCMRGMRSAGMGCTIPG